VDRRYWSVLLGSIVSLEDSCEFLGFQSELFEALFDGLLLWGGGFF
jgi:hypothetical protein